MSANQQNNQMQNRTENTNNLEKEATQQNNKMFQQNLQEHPIQQQEQTGAAQQHALPDSSPRVENSSSQLDQQMQEPQLQNPMTMYTTRIQQLLEKQEILKFSVATHQQKVKELYMRLYERKKHLLQTITQQYAKKQMSLDISLSEQFQELRNLIEKQQNKINVLRSESSKQELAGSGILNLPLSIGNGNERDSIKLRQKHQQLSTQIQSGHNFASSQYVRDYLERTYIHKVSYQDVKYQYEMKTKLKQYLKQQKQAYDKRKQELKKNIEKQGMLKRELEDQKVRLQAAIAASNKVNGGSK